MKNCESQEKIYLVDDESNEIVDSSFLKNGTFEFNIDLLHEKPFTLHNKRNQYEVKDRKRIWLEPGNIFLTGDYKFLGNSKVSGSVSQLEYLEYEKLKKSNEKVMSELVRLIENKKRSLSHPLPELPESYINTNCKEVIDTYSQFIEKKDDSYVSLNALYDLNLIIGRFNQEEIKKLYNNMSESVKLSEKSKKIARTISLPKIPLIGDKYIDIVQPNPNGDTVHLSSYEGRYILLSFWASWCPPCRAENALIKKINKKYKSENIVIFGVSADRNRNDWLNTIKKDSLNWMNVSDLNGWDNRAFEYYEVKALPYGILLDKKGTIIGKFGCPADYNEGLKKVFGY